jgi:hypothetical protein
MTKTKNETAEETQDSTPEAVAEPEWSAGHAEIKAQLTALEARLARVEQAAHTEHTATLGKDALEQITAHAVRHVDEHWRRVSGHSGLPSYGGQ